ncbi:zinc ABC transporter substrate-binding protein [Paenirhodobacter sp.]|uniref:zinc ABC transporter substrate-binding protein n=1 Tax=Paenirhodobacter sp. TaxID=1965326 RepID=UPI003B50AD80
MRAQSLIALALWGLPSLALAEVPRVVTDIAPIQSLAAQVMGELGTPEVLLPQGANAHSYQMKPSQARALQSADLLLWVGPEMTPWLDRALDAATPGKVVALLHVPGTHQQDFAPGAEDDDDDDHDGHDHDHAGEGEAHHHSGLDPHAWLDPGNAELWLDTIAQQLSALDPEHAATYAANATAAHAQIAALDGAIAAEFAPLRDRPFVVFHAAYGYFVSHYGLTLAGAVSMGDATSPGAAHLAELRAELARDAVVCAFPEPNHDPRPIQRLVEGTPVKLGAALDPEGSTLTFSADLYQKMIRGMADTMLNCLSQG